MTAEPGPVQSPPVPSAPTANTALREDRRAPLVGFVASFIILAAILSAALLGYRFADQAIRHRSEAAFDAAVQDIISAVDKRLALYQDVLYGFQALYAASKSVEADEFKAFYDSLKFEEKFLGLRAVDYAEYVPAAQREAFLERMRAQRPAPSSGEPPFSIQPDGQRESYIVIMFAEPSAKFSDVLGLDVGAEAIRREAAEKARDSGGLVASGPVTLMGDASAPQPAFLLFLPVYRNGMPADTVDARRGALQGYLVGVFRARELMADLLSAAPAHPSIDIEVFRGTLLAEEHLLFDTRAEGVHRAQAAPGLQAIKPIEFGGRVWTVMFRALPEFGVSGLTRWLPLAVLWLGIIFGLLVFAFVQSLSTSRSQAIRIAGQMTGDLRRSEAYFRSLIDHAMDITTILEANGTIRYETPSVERVLGYAQQELIGQNAFTYMHPDDVQPTLRLLSEAVLIPGATRSATFRFRHKDGSWRTLEAMGTNQLFNPSVLGIVINSRDVTDRLQAQQMIRDSEERFRTLVANIPGAVYRCACASDWRMVFISDAIEALSGYPAADFVDSAVRTYASVIHPEDRLRVERTVLDAAVRREPFTVEYRIQHKDGTARWVTQRGLGVFGEDGRALWIDGVIVDITERRRIEDELRIAYHAVKEAQTQLVQSEKLASIGRLAAGVAHEVKNPLAIVIQGVNFLEMAHPEQNGQDADVLQMMKKAILRADLIIKDLLEFARPSQVTLRPTAIQGVVEESVRLVQTQKHSQKVTVALALDPAAPPVPMDENHMRQVLINLILNAFQAMPGGGEIAIRARVRAVTQRELQMSHARDEAWRAGQEGLVIEVEDTGAGIPAAVLSKVFDPFFTTKPPGEGTGLGLSITQSIMASHHGLLLLESQEGRGTRITLVLPLTAPEAAASSEGTRHA